MSLKDSTRPLEWIMYIFYNSDFQTTGNTYKNELVTLLKSQQ